MKTNIVILLALIGLSLPSITNAQALQTPLEESETSHPQSKSMLSQMFGGDEVEQYNKGYYYLTGTNDVKQSNSEAKKWFELAAKTNVAAVRYKIGLLYETGTLYQQSYTQAAKHYKFAAASGDNLAKNNLAILYLNGEGVTQDVAKAIALFTAVAESGFVEAQVNLGLYYLNAKQEAHNSEKALKWFTEAEKDNHPVALYYLAEHAFAEKDYVKAYDYYLMSAKQSNNNAQLKLAMLYAKGLGIEKNSITATNWLTKAAKLGNKKAIAMLGYRNK
jgi:TPR repeat protein